jgi:predicted transposase/invertase (TIGR01784 family)
MKPDVENVISSSREECNKLFLEIISNPEWKELTGSFENEANPEIDEIIELDKKLAPILEKETDDGLERATRPEIFRACCRTEPIKDPKEDFTFKHLLGSKKNKPLSISFINSVFEDEHVGENHKVTDLEFITTLKLTKLEIMLGRADILAVDADGRMIVIEKQKRKRKQDDFLGCLYPCFSYLSANQLDRGQEYKSVQEVTIIALADYDIFPNKPGYISNYLILDTEIHTRDFKSVRYVVINLKKFNLSIDQVKTPLEKWLYFCDNATRCEEEDIERISGDGKIFKQAFSETVSYSWSMEEQIAYIRYMNNEMVFAARIEEAWQLGWKEGFDEGIDEGRMKKRIDEGIDEGMDEGRMKKIMKEVIEEIIEEAMKEGSKKK